MKALLLDGVVVDLTAAEFEVHSDLTWMDAPVGCEVGWILNGGALEAPAAPTLTQDEQLKLYKDALHDLLNEKANEKNYDNEDSIMSYLSSSNATWQQEATDYNTWRDALWTYAIGVFDNVTNEIISPPTVADFIAGAPALVWSA